MLQSDCFAREELVAGGVALALALALAPSSTLGRGGGPREAPSGGYQHPTGFATLLVKLFPDWPPDSLKPVAVLGGEEQFPWLWLDPVGMREPSGVA